MTMFIFTVRNKVANVMFLHVSVCPQGGVPGQVPHWDQVHPRGPGTPPWTRYNPPWDQVHPQTRYTPLGPGTPPPRPGTPSGTRYTPRDQVHPTRDQVHPRRRLLLRTVRILLECILFLILQTCDDSPRSPYNCTRSNSKYEVGKSPTF